MLSDRFIIVAGTLFVALVVYGGCCFGVLPLMDKYSPDSWGAVFVYASFGMIAAAAGLLSILGVVGPQPLWERMSLSLVLGLVWFCCWFTGLVVREYSGFSYRRDGEPALVGLCCLPLALLALQTPLWVARLMFRWRLEAAPSVLGQLTIRDMLAGTGMVALAFAGAQAALRVIENPPSTSEFWFAVLITAASMVGFSLAATIPLMLATLKAGDPVVGLVVVSGYTSGVLIAGLTIANYFAGWLDAWAMFGWTISTFFFVIGMVVPLLVLRLQGVRLAWGREPQPRSVPNEDFDTGLTGPADLSQNDPSSSPV